jgi:NAD(P)-dependent dehydrogenase (short-subunit alcohol dehydrogenase family)
MSSDRTIVITGAASGLGRAWAEGFARQGATVIAADLDGPGLERLAAEHSIVTDVADADQVERMIVFAIERTGRIDALFNNAGLGYAMRVEESPKGAFEQHVAVHLFGTINGMRAVIPHMRRQGYGRIINTISRNAENDVPGTSAYAAAKAAIWAASRVAARELKDMDILVNMLIPGPTNTSIWGRDMPQLQQPEATFPTARMLASLPEGGPSGKVFWDGREYPMFHPDNEIHAN